MIGPMKPPDDAGKLWRWMYRNGITLESFASTIGVSLPHLSNIRNGKAVPSDRLKARIEAATSGAIKATSWYTREALKAMAKS